MFLKKKRVFATRSTDFWRKNLKKMKASLNAKEEFDKQNLELSKLSKMTLIISEKKF